MKIIAFLICLTALLTGCHKEVADPIGIDDTDHIKLSAKELLFDATASKQPVTTEGDFWWMDRAVYVDGKRIDTDDQTLKIEFLMGLVPCPHPCASRANGLPSLGRDLNAYWSR